MRTPEVKRDCKWLRDSLQSAIELELSTIPPYLCGLWALDDSSGSSYASQKLLSIVEQEMAHLGLACNMLCAVGGTPRIFDGYDAIEYPGPLPGGVRPACDPQFFPCDSEFEVVLGFVDFKAFAKMCMQIEYPEDPVPRPLVLGLMETFTSIGAFYDAVLAAFEALDSTFEYSLAKQLAGPLKVFTVDGLSAAKRAINQIQQQGEGASRYPYYEMGQLAHFYSFGELYKGKAYVYDADKQTGDWSGSTIDVPKVRMMSPVPKSGYTNPPQAVADCDDTFTRMLKQLDDAWSGGDQSTLTKAIASMTELADKAKTLLGKQIARTGTPGIYGPQFRKSI